MKRNKGQLREVDGERGEGEEKNREREVAK